ncbi:MAG TPA: redox-sensing transcriptional repressor Rex [Spirochaetia bacterium]|nr:redox-sensing transcriptional repressor Rex [Spirochaetia bacterium]
MKNTRTARTIDRKAASLPTIRRLPGYLQVVRSAEQEGVLVISGTTIAEELELEPIQVRKDLAVTGIVGKPRVGYVVKDLIAALEHFLRWDQTHNAVVLGAGHLGTALLGHTEFRKNGLNISAGFDSDPAKVGKKFHGIKILDASEMLDYIRVHSVTVAILTVPPHVAQDLCNQVIEAGVKLVWNFTNLKLKVPDGHPDVLIQKEDLSSGYAVLSVRA